MTTPDAGDIPINPLKEKPGSDSTVSSFGSGSVNAVNIGPQELAVQDLSGDRLLVVAPRGKYLDKTVPTLGGIPLLAKIGQGGMGAVYHGVHPRLNKEVAVKVLPLHLVEQQPNLVHRFVREAQIAAQVISPHLVAVSDVNQESGLCYLVMEFVNGTSAGSLLKSRMLAGRGPFEEAMALDVCIAATAGLVAAHNEGIIHRDIKPDNILIPRSRQASAPTADMLDYHLAKLADLGLARTESVSAELTGTQSTMGTPGYIAPEQAMNSKKAAKPADVFSMGATLYALLVGQAPFVGDTPMEAILAALQRPHTPLKEFRPDVCDATASVVERCMAKTPNYRYPDAAALLQALQAARASVTEAAGNSENVTVMNMRAPDVSAQTRVENPNVTIALDHNRDSEFLSKVQEGENLLTAQLFPEAIHVFKDAKATWPNARDLFRAEEGLRAAERAIADQQFKEILKQAGEHLGSGNFEAAEKTYITALSKRPSDAEAQRGLKESRTGKVESQYKAAMDEIQGLLNGEKHDEQYWYVGADKRTAVEEAIQRALRIKPNDAAVRGLRDKMGPAPDLRLDMGNSLKLDMVLVPAGEFMMGGEDEKPIHRVKITQSYYISKFPITVAQFRRFVEATTYRSDGEKDIVTTTSTGRKPLTWKTPGFEQRDDHPVVVATWNDAQAFTAWAQRQTSRAVRLPTEAEWEFAARGPAGNIYPWGKTWDGKEINHADVSLRKAGKSDELVYSRDNDGFAYTSPAGTLQNASWCGAFDMAGNVWEWCQDVYDREYYKVSPENNPLGPAEGKYRVLRGGAWNVTPENCRLWVRLGSTPAYRDNSYGFRIVVPAGKVR